MKQEELRLWPGVAAVALQWALRYGLPIVWPDGMGIGVIGGVVCGLFVLIWWIAFSRAAAAERWSAVILLAAAMAITPRLADKSIATGMMGMLFYIYVTPLVSLALVAWAAASQRWSNGMKRVSLLAAILLACGVLTLVRTEGMNAAGQSKFAWRWSKTPEQKLVEAAPLPPPAKIEVPPPQDAKITEPAPAPAKPAPAAKPAVAKTLAEPEWPGFRGPHRDGVVRGSRIRTDWAATPPVALWRHSIGPGWSSFAVSGNLVFTQEQRGEFEVVACYKLDSGEPVWTHRDEARFWESNAGAGPRGTPTLSGGRVYAFGATGILKALNAVDGSAVWTRNVSTDTGAKIPGWGFSSSPIVGNGSVIVAASGRLASYDIETGNKRWVTATGGGGYSSPHPATIAGVPQILLISSIGTTSVAPEDGKVLWKHAWEVGGAAILQPALLAGGDLLITTGDSMGGAGTKRLTVSRSGDGWSVQERWLSKGLKPYFNDMVIHKGHAFGFDGSILSCIDLEDGNRKWKGGRYGHGQMLLLADQDLLLVLSEDGELALVSAGPGEFREIARFRALDGKTWNHPVLVGNILIVRNGEEMAAFRLPREES